MPEITTTSDTSTPDSPQLEYDFYAHQTQMSAVLLGWGVGSMVMGALWWRVPNKSRQATGTQFLVWGAIDAALALNGLRTVGREAIDYADGKLSEADVDQKARVLRRILWVNYGLDNLYMIWGGRWMQSDKPQRRGAGIGIFVQGAFLWIFDYLYAIGIRRP